MDERTNCMACLAYGDDGGLVPGVVVIDGVTHALTTAGDRARHYPLCVFDENGVLETGAYYASLVSPDQILWTSVGGPCLPGKQS